MTYEKNRLFKRIILGAFLAALLWLCIAVTDYIMVIGLYQKPVFCLARSFDENGGVFDGLGYSYIIEGNFGRSENSRGMESAELDVFGIEAKKISR